MLEKIKKVKLESIILFIFIFSIILDNVNGAIMLYCGNSFITLGKIVRIVIMVYLIFLLLKNVKILNYKKIIFSITLFFSLPLYFFIKDRSFEGFIENELYMLKLLFPILIISTLYILIFNKKISSNIIEKIFKIYSIIVPLTILIPKVFRLGYESYLLGGYKGFYYSNNEINVVLLCTFIYAINELYNDFKPYNFILTLVNLVSLFLIGSKTSIISIAIIIAIYIIILIRKRPSRSLCYIIGTIITVSILSLIFNYEIKEVIQRLTYYYENFKANGDNFIDFMTSSRSKRILQYFNEVIFQKDGFINLLLGVGRYNLINNTKIATLIESDLFDVIFQYGILVAIYIFKIYIVIFINSCKSKENFKYILMFIFVMTFSILAGHVLFSALAGGTFGIICTELIVLSKNNKKVDG